MLLNIKKTIELEATITLNADDILEINREWSNDVESYSKRIAEDMDIEEFTQLGRADYAIDFTKSKYEQELKSAIGSISSINYYEVEFNDEFDWKQCDDFFEYDLIDELFKWTSENDYIYHNWGLFIKEDGRLYASNEGRAIARTKLANFKDIGTSEYFRPTSIPRVFKEHLKGNMFYTINGSFYLKIDNKIYKYNNGGYAPPFERIFGENFKKGYLEYSFKDVSVNIGPGRVELILPAGNVWISSYHYGILKDIDINCIHFKDKDSYVVLENDKLEIVVNRVEGE